MRVRPCAAIGRERGDALEEVSGSGTEIEDHWFLRLSAARRRWLGKGAPGSRLLRILGHKNAAVAVFGFRQGES